MRRRTFLRAAAAIPVALLSGCAVYDDGYYVGDVGYAPVPNPPPRPHSEPRPEPRPRFDGPGPNPELRRPGMNGPDRPNGPQPNGP